MHDEPPSVKALLAWSSGKDSAWALHVLRTQGNVEVVGLLTTVIEGSGQVTMHRVPEEMVEAQAASIGLPLWKAYVPDPCPNEVYDQVMHSQIERARSEGVSQIAFGDLYLEDIRRYREERLAGTGIEPVLPLWGRDTGELALEMIEGGLCARVTCVDAARLDVSFLGRAFDSSSLGDLPRGVDLCGENGEFHTFAYSGPMFREPLAITTGSTYRVGDFAYAEVALAPGEPILQA